MPTQPSPCPVAFATRVIGGKWKPRIVWALVRTPTLRFSELRRACPPISDRILSRELKELEAAGLVRREQQPGLPPRTDYGLTELGYGRLVAAEPPRCRGDPGCEWRGGLSRHRGLFCVRAPEGRRGRC